LELSIAQQLARLVWNCKRGLGFGAVNSTAASLVSLELHSFLFNFYAKAGTHGDVFLPFSIHGTPNIILQLAAAHHLARKTISLSRQYPYALFVDLTACLCVQSQNKRFTFQS
jgi:hypothetical protein